MILPLRHLGDRQHAVEGRLRAEGEHHRPPTGIEEAVRRAVGEARAMARGLRQRLRPGRGCLLNDF